jgi:signal transduction histidine kinase
VQREDKIRLVIQDWGAGFNSRKAVKHGFGLDGVRQRARLLGGQADIKTAPGKGTCITVRLPLLERGTEESP